jgi:UDP-N-acetylmuramoylalanine--D-glutamate ligase
MQMKDKNVLVFGAGKSGICAVKLLKKLEANVLLYDSKTNWNIVDFNNTFDTARHFRLVTGSIGEELLDNLDLVILSPGIAIDHPLVKMLEAKSIPVWGELEFAYRYSKGKLIAITGTNGKTTTTSLIGEILKTVFKEVYLVGNIGNPYTDIALKTTYQSVSIAEVSSFQLETIHTFKPDVSVILNITPDHLDRHHTMEKYIEIKESITKNQTDNELCVINYEDEILRAMACRLNTKVMYFSSERRLNYGIYLENEDIIYANNGNTQKVCGIGDLKILGVHNYENVMAAAAVAIAIGVPMDLITKAVISFQAVEHRIEYVEKIHGVIYYNDSKGTNPDASIKAVQAMNMPTILIGGGYDKKSAFDEWIEAFDGKVKYLVLLGQTREKIAETAIQHGFKNIIMVKTLKEAVRVSSEKANPGDAVLLSPACASWGMFDNYEQRGKLFKKYVREMLE